MKAIFISLMFLTLLNLQGTSQGNYVTNSTLTKFAGTWQWANGTDTVRLHLKKVKLATDPVNGFYVDAIVGYHEYKNGATVIEGSWPFRNESGVSNRTLLATNEGGNDILNGNLKDIVIGKQVHIELTLTNSGNSLIWATSRVHASTVNLPAGYTLPQSLTLTKVNTGGGTED